MTQPDVTIIMSPREKFNLMQRSIESLYATTHIPFNFICIDGGSSRAVRNYLSAESRRRNFKLIRVPHYLAPNEARNIAMEHVTTNYVAFIDNDVVFTPHWLEKLVRCAEETGAAIVSPLICIGEPVHATVHMAGGNASIIVKDGERIFAEEHHFPNLPVADVRDKLVRREVELAEFHCMLVRTEWVKRVGPFDENLKATSEHCDFCMQVRSQGGTVMLEPSSVITNLVGPPLSFSDLEYFFYRWSDEWGFDSERHFHKKWNTVYKEDVMHNFVIPHRREALPRLRQRVRMIVGWNISEWMMQRVGDAFVLSAKRKRSLKTAQKMRA